MHNRKFDAYIGGLSSSLYIDPTPIYHSTAIDLFNYVGYKNPDVDKLIEKGRITVNTEEAAKIWKKVQELIYNDQPYTYLFWIDRLVAVHKRFKNVTPVTLSSIYKIEKWYEVQNQSQLSMIE
jgi:peptide/nickel transport system substrate-binding protein